jgi:hypothetical protein
MLPKNKKTRRQRKAIEEEFSQEVIADTIADSKPVNRPTEMDDIDFYFEGHDPIIDPHQPLDEGTQLTH